MELKTSLEWETLKGSVKEFIEDVLDLIYREENKRFMVSSKSGRYHAICDTPIELLGILTCDWELKQNKISEAKRKEIERKYQWIPILLKRD